MRQAYDPDDIARGGLFAALNHDGTARIERGFIRPEDEKPEPEVAEDGKNVIDGVRVNSDGEIVEDSEDGDHVSALDTEEDDDGKSIRPLGSAAIALLKSINKTEGADYVFPAERNTGYYQGTKNVWSKAIKKAALPGVTPHTLRHTIGSTATSNGEALALTGAILGHANPRSTAIYAHVQTDPSRQASERVTAKIAAALAGKSANDVMPKQAANEIEPLVRSLVARLSEQGVGISEISELVGQLTKNKATETDKAA